MICSECKKENKKSTVIPHGGSRTAMYYEPYYDENGLYHNHDGNTLTLYYSCSNGHKWHESQKKKCPNCDWTN